MVSITAFNSLYKFFVDTQSLRYQMEDRVFGRLSATPAT